MLSYLARSQRTVGDGLEAFHRHAGVAWNNPDAVRIVRHGSGVTLTFQLGDRLPRHVVEFVVGRTAISLRRSGARPTDVAFAHPPGGPVTDNPAALGPAGRVHANFEDVLKYLAAHRDQAAPFLARASWEMLHTPPFGGPYAMGWAQRLKRVFRIDIERCERCGGQVRIIASIEDPAVVGRILAHREQRASAPADLIPAQGPRGPPAQRLLDLG